MKNKITILDEILSMIVQHSRGDKNKSLARCGVAVLCEKTGKNQRKTDYNSKRNGLPCAKPSKKPAGPIRCWNKIRFLKKKPAFLTNKITLLMDRIARVVDKEPVVIRQKSPLTAEDSHAPPNAEMVPVKQERAPP